MIDAGGHGEGLKAEQQLVAIPFATETYQATKCRQGDFSELFAFFVKEPQARGRLVHVLGNQRIPDVRHAFEHIRPLSHDLDPIRSGGFFRVDFIEPIARRFFVSPHIEAIVAGRHLKNRFDLFYQRHKGRRFFAQVLEEDFRFGPPLLLGDNEPTAIGGELDIRPVLGGSAFSEDFRVFSRISP